MRPEAIGDAWWNNPEEDLSMGVTYRTKTAGNVETFDRERGPADAPAHEMTGTSSHGKEPVMSAKTTTHPTKKLILVAALSSDA